MGLVRAVVLAVVVPVVVAAVVAGCGGGHGPIASSTRDRSPKLPPGYQPIRAGRAAAYRLPALFREWGQPLSATRLARFHGRVAAYVGGRRWRSRVGAIPLGRHAEIVLEVGGYVVPHPAYRFAPGL